MVDSTADTLLHIMKVRDFMNEMVIHLLKRAEVHDQTKLGPEEKPLFDMVTDKLKSMKFGSPEYMESLELLRPALENHYKKNSHHPQHFENGVDGMNILDLMEMLVDWKAATLRSQEGSMQQSLPINIERFNIQPQLASILQNTVRDLEW